jgi:hypothetical protein
MHRTLAAATPMLMVVIVTIIAIVAGFLWFRTGTPAKIYPRLDVTVPKGSVVLPERERGWRLLPESSTPEQAHADPAAPR